MQKGLKKKPDENREKMLLFKPRREASEETNPTDTLILDF